MSGPRTYKAWICPKCPNVVTTPSTWETLCLGVVGAPHPLESMRPATFRECSVTDADVETAFMNFGLVQRDEYSEEEIKQDLRDVLTAVLGGQSE